MMSDPKVNAGAYSLKFANELAQAEAALIRKIRIRAYVPLGIAMLLSAAAIAVAVLCFPLSSAAAIGLFCVAAILLGGGIIHAVVVHRRKDLQLFMGSMKELLEPYWENYKSAWQAWDGKLSSGEKRKFSQCVPNDPFQLPIVCDEKALRRKFFHIADCFNRILYDKSISDNACTMLTQNFIETLAILPEKELKILLTTPLNKFGYTLISIWGNESCDQYWKRCDFFMQSMAKLNIKALRDCYLNLFLELKNEPNWTRLAILCAYASDSEVLREILDILAEGKYVQLEHLLKCTGGSTILGAATVNYAGKNINDICEKIWDFLWKVLPEEDLKTLCLTNEKNEKLAILNFLRFQSSIFLRRKCLEFIGKAFNDDEKDKLFIGDGFLNFIYSKIVYHAENDQERDEIIGEITGVFGSVRLNQYFGEGPKLYINGTVETIEESCRGAEEFIAFLSRKFDVDFSKIEIVKKINESHSSDTSEEYSNDITAKGLDESNSDIGVVYEGKDLKSLPLFMNTMKGLLMPYWKNYRRARHARFAIFSDKGRKKLPTDVPHGLFDLPEECDESILHSKLLHIVNCFHWVLDDESISDEECEILMRNFSNALANLSEEEFKIILTVPCDEFGYTLVCSYNCMPAIQYRKRCDLFTRIMMELEVETLRNCYLSLFLEQKGEFGWTCFGSLCGYASDPKLLEEILGILHERKCVQLAHVTECGGENTILSAAISGFVEKNVSDASEKVWNFLCKILSDEELKKVCLTIEKYGHLAILQFLRWQKNLDLGVKCLEFIGRVFNDDEKDQLFVGDDFLDFIFFATLNKSDETKNKIINEIIKVFGEDRVKQYLKKKLNLNVYWVVKAEDVETFTALLRKKLNVTTSNIKIIREEW
ncbi:MAG: hypothetical protein LBI69_04455 [Puniceicoccales bacterium]|jgi:hypothetical protein|nr:hypothetical protein [Puniceicoccales bacterium]